MVSWVSKSTRYKVLFSFDVSTEPFQLYNVQLLNNKAGAVIKFELKKVLFYFNYFPI